MILPGKLAEKELFRTVAFVTVNAMARAGFPADR
jgi:hypothetical protein